MSGQIFCFLYNKIIQMEAPGIRKDLSGKGRAVDEGMNITGNRVILRAVEAHDRELLESLIHDPEIVKITGGYRTPASCMRQMSSSGFLPDAAGGMRSIIADLESPKTGLGIIMLSHMDSGDRTGEIYIKLIKSARGKGYGRDAVDTLVSYAFGELGLQRIRSSIVEHNTASRKMFEACGFCLKDIHENRKVCLYEKENDSAGNI